MESLPNLDLLTLDDRIDLANKVAQMRDFRLPDLQWMNSEPCARHTELSLLCSACGIKLYKHQRVGVAWLYLRPAALVADVTGSGKTASQAGLLAALKETGEITVKSRVLVVTKAQAVDQLSKQLIRMLPKIPFILAAGVRAKRVDGYVEDWEICVISYQTLINDHEMLERLNVKIMILDDCDPLRNRETRAAHAINRIAANCHRVVEFHATSFQKHLKEIWSVFQPLGGREFLGATQKSFTNRYVVEQKINGKKEIVGYQRLDELKRLIGPYILRRTEADIDDIEMPKVIPEVHYLDLHPAQRAKYQQLQRGALEIIRRDGEQVSMAVANAAWMYGNQICGGLAVLGEADGPGTSSKMDWLENFVEQTEEKIVAFFMFKNGIAAMEDRLTRLGVGHTTVTGDVRKKARAESIERFWDDPKCKVMHVTTAAESSLNLQVARHIVAVDSISNAMRMTQLIGRIKRVGSAFHTVYMHTLLANDTQQERLYQVLRNEAGLVDHVFDSESELYEALSPMEKMNLIGSP